MEGYIWPGFVDALATLLMVIIFVLMVFFLIQINLAQRVSGQNAALEELRGEISSIALSLNIARDKNATLTVALNNSAAQIAKLNDTILAISNDNVELESNLESVTLRAETAEDQLNIAKNQISVQQESLTALRARLEEITEDRNAEAIARRTAEDQTRASKKEVLILNQSVIALKERLNQLQALLEEEEEKSRQAKEASVNLSQQLNNALTSKVLELQKFRSDFFGRLREVLKDRPDLTIVGDRFVFQSEVLFAPGSADIGIEGQAELTTLSTALLEISENIPTDIDWVLQVTGHTDNIPIHTPRFRDNWDLSAGRALSVVRYLIQAGIDPKRLSAAGFGEYHPIDNSQNLEALARNRRIELKLTKR
jgi:chemotaxis protein MotB